MIRAMIVGFPREKGNALKIISEKLAGWLRGEEAMAALVLSTAGQIPAQAVNKPGLLSLRRIARRRPSTPAPRRQPQTTREENEGGKQE